jgi:hypothetical protein
MGCFIPPLLGPGEHLFEQAASIQARMGPITIRPDGIKDDRLAWQYIAQVRGILGMVEFTSTGKALLKSIRGSAKPVLIFPLVPDDPDEPPPMAWVFPRMGLYSIVMSYTPLFGQRLRKFLGGDAEEFDEHIGTPHEVIVHELTHVARAVSVGFGRLGHDEEELANMVANIFAVEINRHPVNNYDDNQDVQGDLTKFSRKYYQDNFDMIQAFCKQNRSLAYELSDIKTAFNPIRQYIDENI